MVQKHRTAPSVRLMSSFFRCSNRTNRWSTIGSQHQVLTPSGVDGDPVTNFSAHFWILLIYRDIWYITLMHHWMIRNSSSTLSKCPSLCASNTKSSGVIESSSSSFVWCESNMFRGKWSCLGSSCSLSQPRKKGIWNCKGPEPDSRRPNSPSTRSCGRALHSSFWCMKPTFSRIRFENVSKFYGQNTWQTGWIDGLLEEIVPESMLWHCSFANFKMSCSTSWCRCVACNLRRS